MSAWERRHNGRRIYATRTTAGTWVAHLDDILNGERVPGVFPTRKAAFAAACLLCELPVDDRQRDGVHQRRSA